MKKNSFKINVNERQITHLIKSLDLFGLSVSRKVKGHVATMEVNSLVEVLLIQTNRLEERLQRLEKRKEDNDKTVVWPVSRRKKWYKFWE